MASVLTEIENRFDQLSPDEQLWLIERLVQRLRKSRRSSRPSLEEELTALAADPEIQRELKIIQEEFSGTESDGLENRE